MLVPRKRTRKKRRDARQCSLHVKLPAQHIRAKFLVIYELDGAQRGVNYLTRYYRVAGLKLFLDGRRVPRKCCGVYFGNRAYFTRIGLKRGVVLHELYHHLVEAKGLEMPVRVEEKEANVYAREFLKVRPL